MDVVHGHEHAWQCKVRCRSLAMPLRILALQDTFMNGSPCAVTLGLQARKQAWAKQLKVGNC
jgi:hypothetical protein